MTSSLIKFVFQLRAVLDFEKVWSSCIYQLKVWIHPIYVKYRTANYFIKQKAMPVNTKNYLEVLSSVACTYISIYEILGLY